MSEKEKEIPFIVEVREIWIQPFKVIASNSEDAVMRVREGEGEVMEDKLEYSSTMDPEDWIVHKEATDQ